MLISEVWESLFVYNFKLAHLFLMFIACLQTAVKKYQVETAILFQQLKFLKEKTISGWIEENASPFLA